MPSDPALTPPATDAAGRLPRIPIETEVRIQFGSLEGFVDEYAANLSMGGMFIRTQHPQPRGTRLHFELKLSDDFELIKGHGEVMWVRQQDEGADRPAGMGVRFLTIDPDSREMIFRVVDRYIQRGGTPFDLGGS